MSKYMGPTIQFINLNNFDDMLNSPKYKIAQQPNQNFKAFDNSVKLFLVYGVFMG
ncbi:hypothetical protein KFK09_029185 [Dendrobium nobile]|uniref:Uncharacterized protein n=1 Tax=Dendrobium nobile TaxID=94219 RepID=A0A8T3A9W9_DENNO|nr:hypothetical protein KFK09_029185 [Dendrobium nobile]